VADDDLPESVDVPDDGRVQRTACDTLIVVDGDGDVVREITT
jgi:hypothetical protein